MKKTLTVNLGGTVYHIDEDAYVLLDNYLNNLRYHFRKSEGAEEIVRDIEARIAELFDEYLHQGHQVVTIEEVEAVIARMGKPEELNDGTEEGEATAGQTAGPDPSEEVTRRLFRDPDDRILGGVASGWAAYLGLDATWIRIILILIGLFFHGIIFLYLICWIVMPLAHTATEKLQMRGKPVNVENIGKTVTDGFEHVNESIRSEKTQSFLHQLAGGLTGRRTDPFHWRIAENSADYRGGLSGTRAAGSPGGTFRPDTGGCGDTGQCACFLLSGHAVY